MYKQFDEIPFDYRHTITAEQKEKFFTNNNLYMENYEKWRAKDYQLWEGQNKRKPGTSPQKARKQIDLRKASPHRVTSTKKGVNHNDKKDWRYYEEWNNHAKNVYTKI